MNTRRIVPCLVFVLGLSHGFRPETTPAADEPPAKTADKPVVVAEQVKEYIVALKMPAKRKDAILSLARAGIAGRAAEPELVKLLRDPDREVRLLAAYALEKLETGK